MLQWTKQFESGQAQIDFEHKMLIGYINQLEGLAHVTNPTREDIEFILNLVDFMENYTVVHFGHEESCMARFQCPAHMENLAAHGHFLEFFRNFKHRFITEGCRPEVLKDLHATCHSWIKGHILNIDTKLKQCHPKPPVTEPGRSSDKIPGG